MGFQADPGYLKERKLLVREEVEKEKNRGQVRPLVSSRTARAADGTLTESDLCIVAPYIH